MTKEIIDSILNDTNGEIIYIEQLLSILGSLGYSSQESNSIRKAYAKKYIEVIDVFEQGLKHKFGADVGTYVISKIRKDSVTMYWKCHEEAYKVYCNKEKEFLANQNNELTREELNAIWIYFGLTNKYDKMAVLCRLGSEEDSEDY